jgi:hypothetical protein
MRLDFDLGTDMSPDDEVAPTAIISPDGTRLVYLSQSKLFTRRLDEANATDCRVPKEQGLPSSRRAGNGSASSQTHQHG